MADYSVWIAGGTFAITCIAYLVKLTLGVKSIETNLRNEMDAHIENVTRDVFQVERGSMSRAETLRHETGEMGAALRTKIHEVEVWTRDTFVKQDGFDEFRRELREDMKTIMGKLDSLSRN